MTNLLNNCRNSISKVNSEDYRKKLEILKYLIFNRGDLFTISRDKIELIKLFEDCVTLKFVWDAMYAYAQQHPMEPVYKDALLLDLNSKLEEYTEPDKSELNKVIILVTTWFDSEKDVSSLEKSKGTPSFILDFIAEYNKEYELNKLAKELIESPEQVTATRLKEAADSVVPVFKKPTSKNPFSGNPNEFLAQTARIPLGIDFIDSMLDGGTLPGEVVAFIIPSGGGKTTLAMQGTAACVVQRKHVLVTSFEQKLAGDIAKRMFVLATRSSRAVWKDNDINKTPAEVQNNWKNAKPLWEKYLHFYDDWVDPDFPLTSVKELFMLVDNLRAQGMGPEVLFIDWWGSMLSKLEASNCRGWSDQDKRKAQHKWLHDIKGYSEEYGIRTFVFHQLAGDKAAKSSNHVASAHDAMENKNFPIMFDYCFVASKKSSDDIVVFKLDKARSAKNDILPVRLDGEHCVFVRPGFEYGSASELLEPENLAEIAESDFTA